MRFIYIILFFNLFVFSQAVAQRDSLVFLALGDSYTAGTSELKINSWPEQLVRELSKKKIAIKAPTIIAGAGWTTEKLISEIEKNNPKADYDLVSLLIGVNNQYRGMDFEVFKKDFPILIETAIKLAQNDPSNVFVLSIPDWGVMPFAKFKDREKISSEIAKYNALIKQETEKRNIYYFDITKNSKNALFDKNLIASDSLHPSKKMYKSWVSKVKKKLIKILQ